MNIPIKNIYFLLCYAWNKLEEKERVTVSIDDHTELIDLLAKVLINATRILLKRGIDRNYVPHTEELAGIKGKLELSASIKRNLLRQMRAVCQYDEFSADILTNQILVSTLHKLMRTENLDMDFRRQARNLVSMFPGISLIDLQSAHFRRIRLHRNNQFYGFIIKICELIHESLLPAEEPGKFRFADFRRDERKMNQLFEAFVFNFYRIEQSRYQVRREQIKWQLGYTDPEAELYLPIMQTDITLENQREKIIIDTKYYRETLAERYGKEKVKSGNLYQLFSYLIQQRSDDPKTHKAKGILLYPTIEKDYDLVYSYQGHEIQIRTVNLNMGWREIRERLMEVIGDDI